MLGLESMVPVPNFPVEKNPEFWCCINVLRPPFQKATESFRNLGMFVCSIRTRSPKKCQKFLWKSLHTQQATMHIFRTRNTSQKYRYMKLANSLDEEWIKRKKNTYFGWVSFHIFPYPCHGSSINAAIIYLLITVLSIYWIGAHLNRASRWKVLVR